MQLRYAGVSYSSSTYQVLTTELPKCLYPVHTSTFAGKRYGTHCSDEVAWLGSGPTSNLIGRPYDVLLLLCTTDQGSRYTGIHEHGYCEYRRAWYNTVPNT